MCVFFLTSNRYYIKTFDNIYNNSIIISNYEKYTNESLHIDTSYNFNAFEYNNYMYILPSYSNSILYIRQLNYPDHIGFKFGLQTSISDDATIITVLSKIDNFFLLCRSI